MIIYHHSDLPLRIFLGAKYDVFVKSEQYRFILYLLVFVIFVTVVLVFLEKLK